MDYLHLNMLKSGTLQSFKKPPIKSIFNLLKGQWTVHREIKSLLPSLPSGRFVGTATFTAHFQSTPKSTNPVPTLETVSYLYHEQGIFTTTPFPNSCQPGFEINVNRRYVYSYQPDRDELSVHFVKLKPNNIPVGNEEKLQDTEIQLGGDRTEAYEIDYVYLPSLEFSFENDRWVARGDHLCVKDMYWAFYDFGCLQHEEDLLKMDKWGLKHSVKGPDKEYTSDTVYVRSERKKIEKEDD